MVHKAHLYHEFDQLDGHHPWQEILPESCVMYPVRNLNHGKVVYFNFNLAVDMGLLPKDHPHELNCTLEKKILSTFCIQIINDYDQKNKSHSTEPIMEKKRYMATRYLQLQHQSKTGKTSGDGRSVWNGTVRHNGRIWDVSSRGTGVTSLAPGFVEAGKPIPTGCTSYGYSCGQAEIDELIGSAIMSEIFYQQGIQTERTLVIINTEKNLGIGVRAALNLIRPAHVFLHLKQNNLPSLIRAADYLIERQVNNREWPIPIRGKHKYDLMLTCLSRDFARFAARLDTDYIFVWLDWDGDNVLANAGIIDYGSVRQFGIRHDQYRYDDVERLSTNLNEQKNKAQDIVKVFAQAVDFIKTGRKKPLELFKNHPDVIGFEKNFESFRKEHLLYRCGFTPKQTSHLVKKHLVLVNEFDRQFKFFERRKISREIHKVPDGINRPALFNMRQMMIEITRTLLNVELSNLTHNQIDTSLLKCFSTFAVNRDQRLCTELRERFRALAQHYLYMVSVISGRRSFKRPLYRCHARSEIINRPDRITGNGIEYVVEAIIEQINKATPQRYIQKAIEAFISNQILFPDYRKQCPRLRGSSKLVLASMESVLLDCKDDL